MAVKAMPVVKNPIRNYGDLKEAVSLWMDRDDDEFVKQIPNFIDFGQKELYRNLRIPPLEKEIYLDIKDGIAYIPPDFLEMQFIMRSRTGRTFHVTSPEEISALREADDNPHSVSDRDVKFARFGHRWLFYPMIKADTPYYPEDGGYFDKDGNWVPVSGAPLVPAESSVILNYYADPEEMVSDEDTSALLTIAPELLLYFALRHSCLFVQDSDGAEKWSALGQASLEEIVQQYKRSEYKGSPKVIPPRGYNKQYHRTSTYRRARLGGD